MHAPEQTSDGLAMPLFLAASGRAVAELYTLAHDLETVIIASGPDGGRQGKTVAEGISLQQFDLLLQTLGALADLLRQASLHNPDCLVPVELLQQIPIESLRRHYAANKSDAETGADSPLGAPSPASHDIIVFSNAAD